MSEIHTYLAAYLLKLVCKIKIERHGASSILFAQLTPMVGISKSQGMEIVSEVNTVECRNPNVQNLNYAKIRTFGGFCRFGL